MPAAYIISAFRKCKSIYKKRGLLRQASFLKAPNPIRCFSEIKNTKAVFAVCMPTETIITKATLWNLIDLDRQPSDIRKKAFSEGFEIIEQSLLQLYG